MGNKIESEKAEVIDYLLAGDLKDLVAFNPDYDFNSVDLKTKTYALPDYQLIKVVEQVGSEVKILEVTEINEKNVED